MTERETPAGSGTAEWGPRPSSLSAGLAGRCPRCGRGHLFRGFLTTAPCCEVCGLDFSFIDAGDGPAWFVMMVVGIVVVAGALLLEAAASPPVWVQLAVWTPVVLILSLGLLRPCKGVLIAMQYNRRAAEGRLESEAGAEE